MSSKLVKSIQIKNENETETETERLTKIVTKILADKEEEKKKEKRERGLYRIYSQGCVDEPLTVDEFDNLLKIVKTKSSNLVLNKSTFVFKPNLNDSLQSELIKFGLTDIKEFGKVISATGSIVAGSFITNIILPFMNEEPNDIDIFIHYGKHYNEDDEGECDLRCQRIKLIHKYLFTYGYKLNRSRESVADYFTQDGMTIRSMYQYESDTGKNIQLIITYNQPIEEIKHFDLDICKAYWDGNNFGNTNISYTGNIICDIGNVKQSRIDKYTRRGFAFAFN